MKIPYWIGLFASISSMLLWIIFVFFNPFTHEPIEKDVMITTFLTLCAPACLALLATLTKMPSLFIFAFIWSLPFSLYITLGGENVFLKLFLVNSVLYLVCGIWMYIMKVQISKGNNL